MVYFNFCAIVMYFDEFVLSTLMTQVLLAVFSVVYVQPGANGLMCGG